MTGVRPSRPVPAAATPVAPGTRRPSILLVTAGLVVAAALWLRWASTGPWILADVEVFVRAGDDLLAGRDLYAREPGVLPFTYPPFGAVVLAPLAVLGMPAAAVAITLASAVAYVVVVAACARRLRIGVPVAVLVALAGLALEPVLRNTVLGQVNLVLAALVVLDLLVLPPRYRGLLVGVAAGVKLTPAIFGLYFVLKRDWWAALRCAAAGAATVAVGWLAAPKSSADFWSGALADVDRFGPEALSPANQSVRAVLARLSGSGEPAGWLVLLAVLAVLGAAVWGAHRAVVAGQDVLAVVVLAVGSLLVSPISWTHHWVWVVPALLVLVAQGHRILAWAVGLVFFVAPMWLLPSGAGAELRYSWGEQLVGATYAVAGLALLGAVASWTRQGGSR